MEETEFAKRIIEARVSFGIDVADPRLAGLYERLLKQETLSPLRAAALLVGCDPDTLDERTESQRSAIEALAQGLADLLGAVGSGSEVRVADAIKLAERAAVPVPASLGALFTFIQKTAISALTSQPSPFAMPGLNISPAAPAAPGGDPDMVTLLGAALNLVSNFRGDVVDGHGLVDPGRIAEAVQSKAVLWFEDRPLPFSRSEIEDILTRWLQ